MYLMCTMIHRSDMINTTRLTIPYNLIGEHAQTEQVLTFPIVFPTENF